MQNTLIQFINKIKSDKCLKTFDEATTKQIIIIQVLNHLGWNIFDVNDIKPEYPVDPQNTNEKVDYALAQKTDNMVFIEAKDVNTKLDSWEKKFCSYCYEKNVSMRILTNGISWWFYLPIEKESCYWRKFYSIDLIQQDANVIATKFIDFLSKTNVLNGKSVENAKKTYESKQKKQIIQKTLPEAWNKLVSSEDEAFIELFISTIEKISGYRAEPEQIAEFLQNNKARLLLYGDGPEVASRRTRPFEVEEIVEGLEPTGYVRTGFTGKNISGFVFNNKRFKVRSWKELLITICEEVSEVHAKDFNKVLSLEGRKRPYFTMNANELRKPEKLRETNIYVETHLSANSIVKLCKDTISLFGYKNSLKIECY